MWGVVALLFVALAASQVLTVQTQQGAVRGRVLGKNVSRAWLGIPYGQDTGGANRFSPPKPSTSWSGVFSADRYGPGCPQHCVLPEGLCPETVSEDCLTLNVYAPLHTQAALRPVMVFIYGGAFAQGVSGCSGYDARYLVATTNTILVSMTYRVGVLGFLINANSNGNYGILDQRLALQWVQQNIAHFGGDPSQVTLFGQSAGAMSTAFHLTDKASWGLFQRVMIQSDPMSLPLLTHQTGIVFTADVAKAIGCDVNDVDCFRQCDGGCLDLLLDAQDKGAGLQVWHPFSTFLANTPMVGPGAPISQNPFELIAAGQIAPNVDVMFSACSQDAVMFMDEAFNGTVPYVDYVGLIGDVWGLENVPAITSRYPSFTSGENRLTNLENLGTDYLFVCSVRYVARQMPETQPYVFVFDHVWSFGRKAWGTNYSFCDNKVCHGAELPFEFGSASLNFTMTSAEFALQRDIQTAVGNFAYTGNPNLPNVIQQKWPTADQNATYMFGTPSRVVAGYKETICDFWDRIGYHHAGNFVAALAKRGAKMRQ